MAFPPRFASFDMPPTAANTPSFPAPVPPLAAGLGISPINAIQATWTPLPSMPSMPPPPPFVGGGGGGIQPSGMPSLYPAPVPPPTSFANGFVKQDIKTEMEEIDEMEQPVKQEPFEKVNYKVSRKLGSICVTDFMLNYFRINRVAF